MSFLALVLPFVVAFLLAPITKAQVPASGIGLSRVTLPGGQTHDFVVDFDFDKVAGPWVLVMSHFHTAGHDGNMGGEPTWNDDDIPRHVDDPNLRSITGQSLGIPTANDIRYMRWWCESQRHDRKLHFRTSNTAIKTAYLTDCTNCGGAPTLADWKDTGSTMLFYTPATFTDHPLAFDEKHTTQLPMSATAVSSIASKFTHNFPFYISNVDSWNSNPAVNGYGCDDLGTTSNYGKGTKHRIWISLQGATYAAPSAEHEPCLTQRGLCANGGTCYSFDLVNVGKLRCACPTGYTGPHCETFVVAPETPPEAEVTSSSLIMASAGSSGATLLTMGFAWMCCLKPKKNLGMRRGRRSSMDSEMSDASSDASFASSSSGGTYASGSSGSSY